MENSNPLSDFQIYEIVLLDHVVVNFCKKDTAGFDHKSATPLDVAVNSLK
jgi:hypothetical protein